VGKKKTRKALKRLAKDLEEAREENRELIEGLAERISEALERQAEANRALVDTLEARLDASEGSRQTPEPGGEAVSLQEEDKPESTEEEEAEPAGQNDEESSETEVTEAAERRGRELGVDLGDVKGTGSGGRVLVKDVEEAAG